MSLVWHIIKKDLRHVWPLVACWFALTGLRIGLLFYFTYFASLKVLNQLTPIVAIGVIADVLLIAAIVRAVVHDDAQVGDRGFWITRPIGWGRLLAAKLTAVVLVCVAGPLLVLVPLWIGLGYSAVEVGRCIIFEAGVDLGIVILAFAGASVTRTAGAFWISTVLFVVVTGFATGAINDMQRTPGDLLNTRLWLSGLLLLMTMSGVVLAQYATRRVGRCIAVILAGAVTSVAINASWSKEIRIFTEVMREGKALGGGVNVDWGSDALTVAKAVKQKRPAVPVLVGTLQVSVPVEASVVSVRLSQVKWTDENGKSHDSLAWLANDSLVPLRISERAEVVAGKRYYGTLGGTGPRMRIPAPKGSNQTALSVAFVAPWIADTSIPLGRVAFSGFLEVDYLGEREIIADVPLISGAVDRRGANRTRVLRASLKGDDLNASVLCVGPAADLFGNFDLVREGVPVHIEFSTWYQASARLLGVHIRKCQLEKEHTGVAQGAAGAEPGEGEGVFANRQANPEAKQDVRLRTQTRRTLAHATIHQTNRVLAVVDLVPAVTAGGTARE